MHGFTLYAVTLFMLWLGIATHWLKQLAVARKVTDMKPISVSSYWFTYWPETLVATFSGIAGYVFLIDSSNLTAINAFGVGYLANSLADLIGNRVQAMIMPGQYQVQPPNGTQP